MTTSHRGRDKQIGGWIDERQKNRTTKRQIDRATKRQIDRSVKRQIDR